MTDKPLTVHIGNLDFKIIPADIEDLFRGLSIETVRLVRDRETDRFKGFGYVEFKDEESTQKALEMDGIEILGRSVRISPAKQREKPQGQGFQRQQNNNRQFNNNYNNDSRGAPGGGQRNYNNFQSSTPQRRNEIPDSPPFTAFIGNCDYSVTDADLAELLNGLNIAEIKVAKDVATGNSRGHCYVEFKDRESLQESLKLDGFDWKGRMLKVDVANRKTQNNNNMRNRLNSRGSNQNNEGNWRPMKQEEFKTLSQEEEKQRKKIVIEPPSKPLDSIGKKDTTDYSKKVKEDPFGGAKPRDENAFLEKMKKLKEKETKNSSKTSGKE